MIFGEAPIEVETEEEAQELIRQDERDSDFDADVLSAPVKLVYSNFTSMFLSFWAYMKCTLYIYLLINYGAYAAHSLSLQNEAASRIVELCILHIAMAEITSMKTKHQIVINEAVDLAKRFCDGRAPHIINGCLRTFVKQRSEQGSEADRDADDSKREDLTQSETMQEEKIRL
ncbi:N utilization substance protein B [Carex littledalei]|uniref:N utilization substance protein B n=1 Tax=Carex littledalei TaxID=544730 RepID=A0A833QM31_9POAL|nr:N utilization substance protein B [Carex littledalei]